LLLQQDNLCLFGTIPKNVRASFKFYDTKTAGFARRELAIPRFGIASKQDCIIAPMTDAPILDEWERQPGLSRPTLPFFCCGLAGCLPT